MADETVTQDFQIQEQAFTLLEKLGDVIDRNEKEYEIFIWLRVSKNGLTLDLADKSSDLRMRHIFAWQTLIMSRAVVLDIIEDQIQLMCESIITKRSAP